MLNEGTIGVFPLFCSRYMLYLNNYSSQEISFLF